MEGGYNGVAKAETQEKKTSDEKQNVKKVNKSSSDILKTMYKNERERRVDVGRRRPQQVEMRMAESQTACCFVVLVLSGSPLSSPPIETNKRNTAYSIGYLDSAKQLNTTSHST